MPKNRSIKVKELIAALEKCDLNQEVLVTASLSSSEDQKVMNIFNITVGSHKSSVVVNLQAEVRK